MTCVNGGDGQQTACSISLRVTVAARPQRPGTYRRRPERVCNLTLNSRNVIAWGPIGAFKGFGSGEVGRAYAGHCEDSIPVALLAIHAAAFVPFLAILSLVERAAADGGFVVEDAEVGKAGSCKVEAWGSAADNRDSILVAAPSCVVDIGRRIEFGADFVRFRDDGEMGSELGLKGKTQLFESGKFSAALTVGTAFDLLTGRHAEIGAVVPLTYEFSEQFKFNVNAGWFWNRIEDQHFFIWGASVEFKPIDKVTLIAEVFGEVGPRTKEPVFDEGFILVGAGAKWPGFQAGLRYTPLPAFDIDFIYGRNITGVDANWFTLGVNVRFDAVERKNGRNGKDRD